jgi:hypothetical protein
MNHHLPKSLIAMVVAFVLLYYGVAWAALRCSHDAEHSDHAVAMEDVDATHQAFDHASASVVALDLECVGPDFHTEAMAEASSPSQLNRSTLDITPHVNDFLTLQAATGEAATDFRLRAVFERSRSLGFLIGPPSYLVLSVLRI